PPCGLVALATSAGGLSALTTLLGGLPADFPAAIVVVQHLDPRHRSHLAGILGRRTALRVKEAEDGEALRPGTVYIAAPDRHLFVTPDATLALTRTEPLHFVRPSADVLFASVAVSFQERAVYVALTGPGIDGEAGVRAFKATGGTVIAQYKGSSEFFGMPAAAIDTGTVDRILPLPEIAPALIGLMKKEATP